MKNIILLMVTACLLSGCGEKGSSVMKIKTDADVTAKQPLPVKVMPHDERPLQVQIVLDKITIGAFLIATAAATFAAIAAWRAADSAKRAAKEHMKILKRNLKK